MCGFYGMAFKKYTSAEKYLLDYTNLSSPTDYEKNDKTIYKDFKNKYFKFRV